MLRPEQNGWLFLQTTFLNGVHGWKLLYFYSYFIKGCSWWSLCHYTPSHNEVVGGYIGFTPSVCPSVHPSRIPCALCSAYSSGWIHIYTSYQATSEDVSCVKFLAKFKNLNFWQFFLNCNFHFVFFWLGIWCESLVWIIMGQQGVSQKAGILVVLVGSVMARQ